jgi:hypothetical protein
MKYHQTVFQALVQKISGKFLIFLSSILVIAGGIAWACSDGDYDDSMYSNFTPQAFVDAQYSPFFYTGYSSYYGDFNDNSNTRFNDQVVKEWQGYFSDKLDKGALNTLLFKATYRGIDSVSRYLKGSLAASPKNLPDIKLIKVNRKQLDDFLAYLLLAKSCEDFSVNEQNFYWDEKVVAKAPAPALQDKLLKAFKESKDAFIKERLWFQMVRYAYFNSASAGTKSKGGGAGEVVSIFNSAESSFPKNMIYYRALGYVAGYHYQQKDYGRANYLYSLCYNFSQEMKIPSKWSFHPQEESDWEKSLALAKNIQEKVTLWQLLGLNNDESRAISKIYMLDAKSEKLDLLLSRLVNKLEVSGNSLYGEAGPVKKDSALKAEFKLVSNIAKKNNTAKPYMWNLAAGYLSTVQGDFKSARAFYDQAKVQLPKGNRLLEGQYRILDWNLYLAQLKTIDDIAEEQMIKPLNWLADLRDAKDTIANLRFNLAVDNSIRTLAALYKKEGKVLKSNCFETSSEFYTSNTNIEQLKTLLSKPSQSPFEKAMLRYYPLKIEDLYYHQGLMLVYQEKTDQAISYIEKAGENSRFNLAGNPFSIRINDCHDCDFGLPQKLKYTPLTFVKAIKKLKADIVAGKDVYVNTFLLADAYYNITHYGNARTFYQNEITGSDATSPIDIPEVFRTQFTLAKLAEKYYLLARSYAKTTEQQTRCTFMAAKCERNEMYNASYKQQAATHKYYWDFKFSDIPTGKYFAELKNRYSSTRYYQEILKECGYFKKYAAKH